MDDHPLAQIRAERGLTQQQLADSANVSKSTVSRIERGWQLERASGAVRRLADSLNVTVEQITAPNQIANGFDAVARWFGMDPANPATRGYLEHLREAVAA